MIALTRIVSINEQIPKVLIPHYATKRRQCLVENFFTVRDKQQPRFSAKLLKEYGEAFRGSQKQHGINFGNVDTFVVEIDNEDEVHRAIP